MGGATAPRITNRVRRGATWGTYFDCICQYVCLPVYIYCADVSRTLEVQWRALGGVLLPYCTDVSRTLQVQ